MQAPPSPLCRRVAVAIVCCAVFDANIRLAQAFGAVTCFDNVTGLRVRCTANKTCCPHVLRRSSRLLASSRTFVLRPLQQENKLKHFAVGWVTRQREENPCPRVTRMRRSHTQVCVSPHKQRPTPQAALHSPSIGCTTSKGECSKTMAQRRVHGWSMRMPAAAPPHT